MRSNKKIDKLNNQLSSIAGKITRTYSEINELEMNKVPNSKEKILELREQVKELRKQKKELEAVIQQERKRLETDVFWV